VRDGGEAALRRTDGDDAPAWVANVQRRRARTRDAMAALEAGAKAAAYDGDGDDAAGGRFVG
jgi:hypothetical protein